MVEPMPAKAVVSPRAEPGKRSSLANIITIAKREVSGYFASPVAYVFIVIFLLLVGFFTFMVSGFFERGQASLEMFFAWHPWLYLFLVPAVGMRMWSEERRLGTIELLLTMPVTPWQAIVGKFIASWVVLILALALTFPSLSLSITLAIRITESSLPVTWGACYSPAPTSRSRP